MTSRVTELPKSTVVLAGADVVVCGGGPAGIIAAVAAARCGATVMLIERNGFFGGMATAALVGPICKFRLRREQIVAGIPWELIERMAELDGAITTLPSGAVPFEAEVYKRAARELISEHEISILLHAFVAGVIETEESGRVTHVIVETKGGRYAIEAKTVIDCTGTGDVISRTKLPWQMRYGTHGELQPLSLVFHLGDVDTSKRTLLMAHDGTKYRDETLATVLRDAVKRGEIGDFGGPWALWGSTIREGQVSVLVTRYGGNAADAESFTAAELSMRAEIPKIVEIFRRHSLEFRDCRLLVTAPQAGIRETRTIEGLYTVTAQDVIEPRTFDDTVAKGGHPVDIHIPAHDGGQDVRFIEEPYDIPYRCMIPKGSKNVIASGGCISAEREAFATIRVQAQCMALGQAAGTAAALCSRDDLRVDQIDVEELRSVLVSAGAIV